MYKVMTKNGSVVFMNLDDALHFIVVKMDDLFKDGSFVKIYIMEDMKK